MFQLLQNKLIDIIIIVMVKEVFKFNKLEILLFMLLGDRDLLNIYIMPMEIKLKYLLLEQVIFNSKELMFLVINGQIPMDIKIIMVNKIFHA